MYILVLILLAVLTHKVWFFSDTILSSSDWGFHHIEILRSFFNLPSIWITSGFGSVNLGLTSYPIELLWGLFGSLCNFSCAERIIYFWPSILIALISSYLLSNKITNNKLAASIGSIVFTYNTYFMIGRTVHLPLMVAFAIGPLAFFILLKIVDRRTWKDTFLLAVVNIVISFYEFRAWYILAILQVIAILFFLFVDKKKSLKERATTILPSFLAIGFVLIMNLYWILSFSMSSSLTSNQYFTRGLFGDSFININNAITLFHPFWTGGKSTIFIAQSTPNHFWIIPFIAFLGLYVNRHNRQIVFFGLVSLVGIFLTKQSGIPFAHIYQFLYDHFPGFNAYREATKFFFLVALGYSVLIAGFVKYLLESTKQHKVLFKIRYFFVIAIACLFIINLKPVVTGEIGTLFVPRHIPEEYTSYKSFVQSQDEFFRTLWIPRESRWTYFDSLHPSVSLAYLMPQDYLDSSDDVLSDVRERSEFDDLLDMGAVKYVAVPIEDTENDDNFFEFYENRNTYIEKLDKMVFLNKLSLDNGELVIYENKQYKNHIYIDSGNLTFEYILPYQYKLYLRNINSQTTVHFSEAYHSGWKMFFGEFDFLDPVTSQDYITSEQKKTHDIMQTNSFSIDPDNLKKFLDTSDYKMNMDGSIDIEATIFFKPQLYVFIGIGLTTIFSFGIVVLVLTVNRKLKSYEGE